MKVTKQDRKALAALEEFTEQRIKPQYARVIVGTLGITSVFIQLDKGTGLVGFRKLCNHPQHWFVDTDGRQIRATAISAFTIVSERDMKRELARRAR